MQDDDRPEPPPETAPENAPDTAARESRRAVPAPPPLTPAALSTAEATALVDAYLAVWREPDPAARAAALAPLLAEGCTYRDQIFAGTGTAALLDYIEKLRAVMPGFVIRRVSEVDLHHDMLRYFWRWSAEGVPESAEDSMDAALIDAEGRFALIAGFIGPPAPAGGGAATPEGG